MSELRKDEWPLWEVFAQTRWGKPHEHCGSLHAPDRETVILNRIEKMNGGPLTNEAAQRIFRQIIDESLRLEEDHHEE